MLFERVFPIYEKDLEGTHDLECRDAGWLLGGRPSQRAMDSQAGGSACTEDLRRLVRECEDWELHWRLALALGPSSFISLPTPSLPPSPTATTTTPHYLSYSLFRSHSLSCTHTQTHTQTSTHKHARSPRPVWLSSVLRQRRRRPTKT